MVAALSSVLILCTVVSVVFGALRGRKQGMKKMLIRTGTILLALFASIMATKLTTAAIINAFEPDEEMTRNFLELVGFEVSENSEVLASFDSRYLVAIPAALIIAPVVFFLTYILFYNLSKILDSFICKQYKIPKRTDKKLDSLIGIGVGAVQGLLCAALLFAPVTGLLNSVDDAIAPAYNYETSDAMDLREQYENDIQPTTDNFLVDLLGACGGNLVFDAISTVDVNDQSFNLSDEIGYTAMQIYMETSNLSDLDLTKVEDDEQESINSLIDAISESDYLSNVLSDMLILLCESLEENADDNTGEDFQAILDATFGAIKGIARENKNEHNLAENISTITEAFFILSDNDVLLAISDGDETPHEALLQVVEVNENGKKITVMSKVASTLNQNKHTVPILTELTKITMASLSSGMGGDSAQLYNDVKEGLYDITSHDRSNETQFVQDTRVTLESSLVNNGIELEDDVMDAMAQHVYDNYDEIFAEGDEDGDNELSDYEMNNIILSYYDVYLDYEESGEEPELN